MSNTKKKYVINVTKKDIDLFVNRFKNNTSINVLTDCPVASAIKRHKDLKPIFRAVGYITIGFEKFVIFIPENISNKIGQMTKCNMVEPFKFTIEVPVNE